MAERRAAAERRGVENGKAGFEAVFEAELSGILRAPDPMPSYTISPNQLAREPFVARIDHNLVGLALSGGGIRSATFNLGLLQGLNRQGILELFDYLATVSGGGYLGGWWSAWRSRNEREGSRFSEVLRPTKPLSKPATREEQPSRRTWLASRARAIWSRVRRAGGASGEADTGPKQQGPSPPALVRGMPPHESREVRHLREFGRFLAPRWGVTHIETGLLVVAVVSALVPGVLTALSVAVLVVFGWAAIASAVLGPAWWTPHLLSGLTLLFLFWAEHTWRRRDRAEPKAKAPVTALLAGVSAGAVILLSSPGLRGLWGAPRTDAVFKALWPRLFEPVVPLLSAAAVLVVARFLSSTFVTDHSARTRRAGVDRTISRLLLASATWSALAALWAIARRLGQEPLVLWSPAVVSAGSATLFALLQRAQALTPSPAPRGGWVEAVRERGPSALSYVALAAFLVTAGLLLQARNVVTLVVVVVVALVVVVVALFFFDPAEVGLHAFYRSRIARAYLGASIEPAGSEACFVDECEDDDVPLDGLPKTAPLHLVCCTANDLSGDPLTTLARRGRSAVLSTHGVSMGDLFGKWTTASMGLASALTASGAAINSNMGSKSRTLGPAGTFLIAALNLRLGLWITRGRHWSARPPASPDWAPASQKEVPGWFFFSELFGRTRAEPGAVALHLSDGGHFDNLGLYELVRRHCRYVIVSDCGHDPRGESADLGNAVRRIREDFGVDIEIGTGQMRKAGSYHRQHVAIGTIHYGPDDKGVLVVVKPSLTSDEPPDVLEYSVSHPAFPQETTGDQFFDEEQWEAYRRLGEHVAETVFRFTDTMEQRRGDARVVFAEAAKQWYPTEDEVAAEFLALTEGFDQVETLLWEKASPELVREVYPETETLSVPEASTWRRRSPRTASSSGSGRTGEQTTLHVLLQVIQLMEDVWLTAHLERNPGHPLNEGWVNYFRRWAAAPSFRRWWPILSPNFSRGFRSFAARAFDLPVLARTLRPKAAPPHEPEPRERKVRNTPSLEHRKGVPSRGALGRYWRELDLGGEEDGSFFVYEVPIGSRQALLQVGLARIGHARELAAPVLAMSDFKIAPGLWGLGIGRGFLEGILDHLSSNGFRKCRLRLPGEEGDPASRRERAEFLQFFAQTNFVPDDEGERQFLVSTLRPSSKAVTPCPECGRLVGPEGWKRP